jgi:hypothetical protein
MTTPRHAPGGEQLDPQGSLTLIEISRILDKHIDTIKARKIKGRVPNHIKKDDVGRQAWLVSVPDLLAAGNIGCGSRRRIPWRGPRRRDCSHSSGQSGRSRRPLGA